MRISRINQTNYNSNNKTNSFSFKSLKNLYEMDWDRHFSDNFIKSAQKNFNVLNKKCTDPHKNNFLNYIFLYYANAVDYLQNFVCNNNKEHNNFDNEEYNKAVNQTEDFVFHSAYKDTLDKAGLIKKISECEQIAENSYIQDRILEMIVGNKQLNRSNYTVIDYFLSNPQLYKNSDNIERAWSLMEHCNDPLGAQLVIKVISNPILFNNDSIQKAVDSLLTKGKNLDSAMEILDIYENEPKVNKNESINMCLEGILTNCSKSEERDSEKILNKYINTKELKQHNWVNKNIGFLVSLADDKNFEIINKLLDTPALYNNEVYTNQIIEILGRIKRSDFTEELISLELLSKINSDPNLYENKNLVKKLNSLIMDSVSNVKNAGAKLTLLDKYISDKKYYKNNDLIKDIYKIITAATGYNNNFIIEIMDDIASKNPKRTTKKNYEIINEAKSKFFKDFNDYELFNGIKEDSINHLKVLSTHNNPVNAREVIEYFDQTPAASCLLKLLGREAFIKAYGLKFDNFKSFGYKLYALINCAPEDFWEMVIQKTNLKHSEKYQELVNKLHNLKKNYTKVSEENNPQKLKNLQDRINKLSYKIREMERKEIKDPQFKINLLRQISCMPRSDAEVILNMVEKTEVKNTKLWNEILLKNVLNKLGIKYDSELIKKLKLKNSTYLDKILVSNTDFKNNLSEIFVLLGLYPDKSVEEIFNNLPQNKTTRRLFENIGADYDKWVKFDKNSKIEMYDDTFGKFVFRKVDMNDVMYSLFLGNYASCCMKAGGSSHSATAPNYIKNKFISAIEVLNNNKPVGNTICYLALVNDRPALILDNISLQPQYRYNDVCRRGFTAYAKKLCEEIGLKDIPVYTTSTRQAVRMSSESQFTDNFVYVGSSGQDEVYIDDITDSQIIDFKTVYPQHLYNFEDIEPEDPDGKDITLFGAAHIPWDNFLFEDLNFNFAIVPDDEDDIP